MQFIPQGKNETAVRFRVEDAGRRLSFREVFACWQNSPDFREQYIELLRYPEFEAYFWEHPGLTEELLDKPYEFILARSANLDRRKVDPDSFAEQFEGNEQVAVFENLGKNALLIAPCPLSADDHYRHLAAFMREAPGEQQHALLHAVGAQTMLRLAAESGPVWLSTAGMGVIWLHIRLDRRPKYYRIKRYRDADYLNKIK